MKRLLAAVCLFVSLAAVAEQPARVTVLDGDNLAQNIVAVSLREDVGPADARVKQAQAWLEKVRTATGEEAKSIAAFSERTSRWFFDATRQRATPLEMLEAMALLTKAGKPMQDTLRDYIQARRNAPGKTHAEGLKALGVAR